MGLVVASIIVFGMIRLGAVLREANIAVVAAMRGARSAAAASRIQYSSPINTPSPNWVFVQTPYTTPTLDSCNNTAAISAMVLANPVAGPAIQTACAFLSASGLKVTEWTVSASIQPPSLTEGTVTMPAVYRIWVSVFPVAERSGLINFGFAELPRLRPYGTITFPLETLP